MSPSDPTHSDSPSAAVPTMDRSGRRRWLYPDRRPGLYATRRKFTAFILIGLYLVGPWLSWNGNPLLRLDVFEKKAYLFGYVLRVNEAGILAPFFATMALVLLLATSVKGRIWCSYACPQTVFVEWLIRPIEEWVEGSAHHRRRIDAGPRTFIIYFKKAVKHLLFLIIAAIVANTFVSFFVGPDRVVHWMTAPPTEHPIPFLAMMSVMLGFYADLAWFREQFCAFLCPYARFQSVMLDSATPTVAYDAKRGDPRGRGESKGDCIDCGLCVRVCPTGIDIRQGLQLECITCARCIDACHMVMTNLERKPGLIRIASQDELAGQSPPAFWRRPKVLGFSLAVLLFIVAGLWRVVGRADIAMTPTRVSGIPYTQMPDGRLGNMFQIRIVNNTARNIQLAVESSAPSGTTLLCAQCNSQLPAFSEIVASAIVAFPRDAAGHTATIINRPTGDQIDVPLLGP